MKGHRQRLGRRGEGWARRHLEAQGYSVRASNYRAKSGEIDLIAERDGVLAFVEVRTRSGPAFGPPEESVTRAKRLRLVAAAQEYLQEAQLQEAEWRIDVIALEMDSRGRVVRMEVIENAVEG